MTMHIRREMLAAGGGRPVLLEARRPDAFPARLSRLGARKLRYLIEGVAQGRPRGRVLELFGGTGLGTVLLARRMGSAERVVSLDLHYGFETGAPWRYVPEENYRRLAEQHGLAIDQLPSFIAADARDLPFDDDAFDMVIAPDAPRTAAERFADSTRTAGGETSLDADEQRDLFRRAAAEAYRVLQSGGVFAATAPRSWTDDLPFARVRLQEGPSPALRFADCGDRVVYLRGVKE